MNHPLFENKTRLGVILACIHLFFASATYLSAPANGIAYKIVSTVLLAIDYPITRLFHLLIAKTNLLSPEASLFDFLFTFGSLFYFLIGLLITWLFQRFVIQNRKPTLDLSKSNTQKSTNNKV